MDKHEQMVSPVLHGLEGGLDEYAPDVLLLKNARLSSSLIWGRLPKLRRTSLSVDLQSAQKTRPMFATSNICALAQATSRVPGIEFT